MSFSIASALSRWPTATTCARSALAATAAGGCCRAVVETQLAGGGFVADVSFLRDGATQRLRGSHALPSHTPLFRFLAGADLGRAKRAQATNTDLLERDWAMGAAPLPGRLAIDPDATYIDTYGKLKEGSRLSYKGEVQMSALDGVIGETGDVLAIRARGANAIPRPKLASFIGECVAAVPRSARDRYKLWIRIDSAGFSKAVVNRAISHKAAFTITAEQTEPARAAIAQLAMNEKTIWTPAQNADGELSGSEVAKTTYVFATYDFRLVVRRQKKSASEQLSFDDLGGFRFIALITNATEEHSAAELDHHHRLRGGAAEEAIGQLKEGFGMNHAPVQNFFGNWVWWLASALSHNIARWLRVLSLPESFATCRGTRPRMSLVNIAARVVRRSRRLLLCLPAAYRHAEAFIAAPERLRRLPRLA